jgi:Domain of unknown function (DUF4386)
VTAAEPMTHLELIGESPRIHARVTGLAGVVTLATGSFAGSVASRLVVPGDAAATSRNIVASELLFRLGVIGNLIRMVAFLFYALLLYRLLRPASKSLAMTMVGLVVAAVPIYMLNQVNQYGALLLASEQRHDQVKLLLDLHRLGNLIAGIFFGLWLFPLELLVQVRLPSQVAGLTLDGRHTWLSGAVRTGLSVPGTEGTLYSNPFLLVTHLSELALLAWLLVMGVHVDRWEHRVRELERSNL